MYRAKHRQKPVKELGGAGTVLAEMAAFFGLVMLMGLMFFYGGGG